MCYIKFISGSNLCTGENSFRYTAKTPPGLKLLLITVQYNFLTKLLRAQIYVFFGHLILQKHEIINVSKNYRNYSALMKTLLNNSLHQIN